MKRKLLAGVACLGLFVAGCSLKTVEAYVNIVVGIAAQVATLAGLPAAAATEVISAVNIVESDFNAIAAADASAKPGLASKLDADLTAAQGQLASLESVAGIKNPAKQAIIEEAVGIAVSALNELEALAPSASGGATANVRTQSGHRTPAQLKASYNALAAQNGLPGLK